MMNNPSAQLVLNGEIVYMQNINFTVSVKRDESDMSGEKTGTAKNEKGVKAKEIQVTGIIPFKRAEWLTKIFNLAEQEDEKGKQTVYRIVCFSANITNIREVVFAGTVSAKEVGQKLAWGVSFKLKEVKSVAEKKETRKPKPAVKVQEEKTPKAEEPKAEQKEQTKKEEKQDNSWSKTIDDFLA